MFRSWEEVGGVLFASETEEEDDFYGLKNLNERKYFGFKTE